MNKVERKKLQDLIDEWRQEGYSYPCDAEEAAGNAGRERGKESCADELEFFLNSLD